MFKLEILTDVHPLKYTAYEIFNRCQLLKQFRVEHNRLMVCILL
jgi:hypothetical protein